MQVRADGGIALFELVAEVVIASQHTWRPLQVAARAPKSCETATRRRSPRLAAAAAGAPRFVSCRATMPPSRRPRLAQLLLACAALPARAGWTGLMGLTFESNRPVETKALYCPTGFITGIRVRYGRTKQEDRDLYDFKLKCGTRWTSWSGLWFKNEVEDKQWECPAKMYVTGMEVKRGRRDLTDRDTYDFKLQCSGVWQSYLGMKFHGHQEEAHKETLLPQ